MYLGFVFWKNRSQTLWWSEALGMMGMDHENENAGPSITQMALIRARVGMIR